MKQSLLLGIGNIYVETNYLGLNTAGEDTLQVGKEYRAQSYEIRLGGSVVNFILQAKQLGEEVGLIGKVGQDEMGEKLISLLNQSHISSHLIVSSSEVTTCVDTGIVLAHSGDNIMFVSGDANQKLAKEDIDLDNPIFNEVQAVYVGGFLKQLSLYADYPKLLHALQERGIKTFLDHGRIPVDVSSEQKEALFASLKHVYGYMPNEGELLGMTGETNLDQALEKALSFGPQMVVVKRGADGCRVKTATEDITVPGYPVSVVTTVGAGDTFNAGFISQYLAQKPLQECAQFATATAAIKVSQNHPPTLEEVQKFLENS